MSGKNSRRIHPEGIIIATATRLKEGRPFPLGANVEQGGINFALFSANATKVELCIFDEEGNREIERLEMPEHTDGIWHGFLSDAGAGTLYGYRVHGPYEPQAGHRFNHNKLLLDPYARAHYGSLTWNPAVFGYTLGHKDGDLSFDERDSAPFVPKCVVVPRGDLVNDGYPGPQRIRWEDTIIYETHVGGFTHRHPSVPEVHRGMYSGLANKDVLDYVSSLGVTSIELLPVHAFLNDAPLLEKGLTNYWGYNTINFFTPAAHYVSKGADGIAEFKSMVEAIHDRGMEVLLDVVYNHTAEGNELGATLSYKGIDNASYYRLQPENPRYYVNDTGTGNTLNISEFNVMRMVTDSLRYWAQEMGVDGFRFDLATILAREPDGFDPRNGFLNAVAQDPILNAVKMIAEPWDCGPGGYQVGGFPAGWAEWNDTFRDITRDFWRGEAEPSAIAEKLLGSPQQFNHDGRRTWASVNFITAHDGFTLHDLVSYNEKHNDANGENNNDGSSSNRSWNCGAEGVTKDLSILALRARQSRNFLSTLLLSQGTPMILAGDERGNTQNGNNNVYCQDNEISWIDWDEQAVDGPLIEFTRKVANLRKRLPIFHSTKFFVSAADRGLGVRSVTWFDANCKELQPAQWQDGNMQSFGVLLDTNDQTAPAVESTPSEADGSEENTILFLAFNAYHDVVKFTLPSHGEPHKWTMILDTNIVDGGNDPVFEVKQPYDVTGRSLVVFELTR